MIDYAARRTRLREKLSENDSGSILITEPVNVTYLTGFTGEDSHLLVSETAAILLSDQRFTTQLAEECPDLELAIRGPGTTILQLTLEVVSATPTKKLSVEADSLSLASYQALNDGLPDCELLPTSGWVEDLRKIKDEFEVELTRRACHQAEECFERVRQLLRSDMTEQEVAAELEYQARKLGGRCLSFPAIVAVGARAALPHANPTPQQIGEAEFTLIDWGVNEGLYVSDLTRILVTGKILPKLRSIYDIVLTAQLAAIDAIKPGVTCEAVDRVARDVIEQAGYGENFGHGLGHGTGLQVHEAPRLARGQTSELEEGMILTVEPGIYLPDWGGVRIEDDILVTVDGHEVLTSTPKQLDECVVAKNELSH